ncbi:MAG: Vps62-related protein [Clostridiales bacterium]|nr:Vps62-related protein [Clostridiales bacterium]
MKLSKKKKDKDIEKALNEATAKKEDKTAEAEQDGEGEEKEKRPFNKKLLLIPAIAVPVLAIVGLLVANSLYKPKEEVYVPPEKNVEITITLDYNEAESFVNYKTKKCLSGSPIGNLPSPQKKGYVFNGWHCGDIEYTADTICDTDKDFTITAQWIKPNECKKAVGFYKDDTFEDLLNQYDAGECAEFKDEVPAYIHIKSGYKFIAYSKKNFEGDAVEMFTDGAFSGKLLSYKIEEIKSEAFVLGALTAEREVELLNTYAPKIWLAEAEDFLPYSIDEAVKYLERKGTSDGFIFHQDIPEKLDDEDNTYDYLYGSFKLAKAYSFFIPKSDGCFDLVYFQYCPYNLGPKIMGKNRLNQIGDWEHISIRFATYTENDTLYAKPVLVCCSANSSLNYYTWDTMEFAKGTTHPIFYSAFGSHGLWPTEGEHTYGKESIFSLKETCSQGKAWDTWDKERLETYHYDCLKHNGTGLGASQWKTYFDTNIASPESNAVLLWGNKSTKKLLDIVPTYADGGKSPQFEKEFLDYYSFA